MANFTLLDICNDLYAVFLETPIITPEDFAGIQVEKEYVELKEDLIRAALKQMESDGFVRETGKDRWALVRPLGSEGQEVYVPFPLAVGIAQQINAFLDAHEVDTGRCDPLNLNTGDIQMLLMILATEMNAGMDEAGKN